MPSLLLFLQLNLVAYAISYRTRIWTNGAGGSYDAGIEKTFERSPQSDPSSLKGYKQSVSSSSTNINTARGSAAKSSRTSVAQGAVALSQSVKAYVLGEHNNYRRMTAKGQVAKMPSATMMNELMWSDAIAAKASEHASKCTMTHTPSGRYCGTDGYNNIGENLAALGGAANGLSNDEQIKAAFKKSMKMWFDEYAHYNFNSRSCSKVCGHFTQMVRDTTERLGCGIAMCRKGITNFIPGYTSYMVVCNYGPGDNYSNQPPYETATGKSCPQVRPVRKDGLCIGNGKRGPKNCVDKTYYCSVWKREGKCALCNNPYYQWMIGECPKTCGIC